MKTTQRFYALEKYAKEFKVDHFFHAELDNLVFDISGVGVALDNQGEGIFVPRDHKKNAIASLIYVNSVVVLSEFCDYLRDFAYAKNEMEVLALYMDENPGKAFSLPARPDASLLRTDDALRFEASISPLVVGVFDAAAIGQWYFGIDARNTYRAVRNMFWNENFQGDLSNYKLQLILKQNRMMISSKTSQFLPMSIHNLHVHSKINSRLVDSNVLVSLLEKTNKYESTILVYNLIGVRNQIVQMLLAALNRIRKVMHIIEAKE